jgi:hypothetical protein
LECAEFLVLVLVAGKSFCNNPHRYMTGELMNTAASEDRMTVAIDRAKRRLEALQVIGSILENFPDLRDELGIGNTAINGHSAKHHALPAEAGIFAVHGATRSNYEKIRDFFVGRKNDWEQAPRIGEALGMTRGTVATVLWTSHSDRFEQDSVPGSVKKKRWRLRPEVLNEAMPD